MLAPVQKAGPSALDGAFPPLYEELCRIARGRLSRATPTLDTHAIVHEAFDRLHGSGMAFASAGHLRAVACSAMRQVVSNYLRDRRRLKRGGGHLLVTLDRCIEQPGGMAQVLTAEEFLDLDRALDALAVAFPRVMQVVEMRFFGGFEMEEIAEALGLGSATVTRDWQKARLFLLRHLDEMHAVSLRS